MKSDALVWLSIRPEADPSPETLGQAVEDGWRIGDHEPFHARRMIEQ